MTLALTRVDDRLIHGQVVEGWLRVIQAERILVFSDAAAADPLQKGMMRLAVPDGVALDVYPVAGGGRRVTAAAEGRERVLVLVPGVAELAALIEDGAPLASVNLGGVHDGPGRTPVAPHLWLSGDEKRRLRGLLDRGVAIETRALPSDEAGPLAALLDAP